MLLKFKVSNDTGVETLVNSNQISSVEHLVDSPCITLTMADGEVITSSMESVSNKNKFLAMAGYEGPVS